MEDSYYIPLLYQEGVYYIRDLNAGVDLEDTICFDNDTKYRILTYYVPTLNHEKEIRLFGETGKDFIDMETLAAFYDTDGRLYKITAEINHQETLLYIRFADAQHAMQEIKSFAVKNADVIIEKITAFSDIAARLFIEYFNDSEAMDFHAKLVTPAQKAAVEKKYPQYDDSGDNPGNYPYNPDDFLYGDNDAFRILVNCAYDGETDFFQYAVDTMIERIREQALGRLQKSEDFQFICLEYD